MLSNRGVVCGCPRYMWIAPLSIAIAATRARQTWTTRWLVSRGRWDDMTLLHLSVERMLLKVHLLHFVASICPRPTRQSTYPKRRRGVTARTPRGCAVLSLSQLAVGE